MKKSSNISNNICQSLYIIAEMAWSHDGSMNYAKKIIKSAADSDANAISVHITSMPDYMVKGYQSLSGQTLSEGKENFDIYTYQNNINIKDKNWVALFKYAKRLGLSICAMPNDYKSLRLSTKLQPDIYVIHASCFTDEDFITAIGTQKKPVLLRIGGATLSEIERAIYLLQTAGSKEIILLHGIQLYPTKIEDTHLNLISSLKNIFGLEVGIADHIDANSPLALIVPLLAIPLGVRIIEKHLTHDRSKKGEDIESALNPHEFKTFVMYAHLAKKAMGATHFRQLSPAELIYRNVSRKKTVAAKNINSGGIITKKHITFKRSDAGIPVEESKYIIGRKTQIELKKDDPILWQNIG